GRGEEEEISEARDEEAEAARPLGTFRGSTSRGAPCCASPCSEHPANCDSPDRMAKAKQRVKEEREALQNLAKSKGDALGSAKRQIKTAAKVAGIALIVIWLICLALWSGLKSTIPLYVGASFTLTMVVAAFLIRRNLAKSEELGAMVASGSELSDEERAER